MAEAKVSLIIVIDKEGAVKAIKQLEGVLKEAGINVEKLETGFDDLAKEAESAKPRLLSVASLLQGIGMSLGFEIVDAVKNSTQAFFQFEQGMANVATLLGGNTQEFERLRSAILQLPPELGSATEMTSALYQALSAGVEPAKAIGLIETAAKAAKGGLSDMFTAVDAITTALNAYGMSADEAGRVSDIFLKTVQLGKTTLGELGAQIGQVAPIAANLGVSLEEVSAALATLTASGQNTAIATTGLAAALRSLSAPTDQQKQAAEDLKIAWDSATLKSKGLGGVLEDLRKAYQRMVQEQGINAANEALRNLISTEEGYRAIVPLITTQSERFAEVLGKVGQSAGSTDEMFSKATDNLNARLQELKNAVEKLMLSLSGILDILTPVIKLMADFVNTITKNKNSLMLFQVALGGLAAKFLLTQKNGQELSGVISKIGANVSFVSGNFLDFSSVMKGGFLNAFKQAPGLLGKFSVGLSTANTVVMAGVAAGTALNMVIDKWQESMSKAIDKMVEETRQNKEAKDTLVALAKTRGETVKQLLVEADVYEQVRAGKISYAEALELVQERLPQTKEEINKLTEELKKSKKQTDENADSTKKLATVYEQLSSKINDAVKDIHTRLLSPKQLTDSVEKLKKSIFEASLKLSKEGVEKPISAAAKAFENEIRQIIEQAEILGNKLPQSFIEIANSIGIYTEAQKKAMEAGEQRRKEWERFLNKAKEINAELERQPEIVRMSYEEWKKMMEAHGFIVEVYDEEARKLEQMNELMKSFGIIGVKSSLEVNQKAKEMFNALLDITAAMEKGLIPQTDAERAWGEFLKFASENWDLLSEDVKENLKDMGIATAKTAKEMADKLNKGAKKAKDGWSKFEEAMAQILADLLRQVQSVVNDIISSFFGASESIVGFFGNLGAQIGSEILKTPIEENLKKLLGETLGSALGGPLAALAGQIGGAIVGGIVGAFVHTRTERLMEDTGRKWGQAISQGLAEEISKTADEIGNTWAAELLHTADILREVGIDTLQDLNRAAEQTRQILSVLDEGLASQAEVTKSIGESFTEITQAMEEMGVKVNRRVIELIRDVRARGLEVKEIVEFINQALDETTTGLSEWADAYLRLADAGKAVEGELELMSGMAAKVFAEAIKNGENLVAAIQKIEDPLRKIREAYQKTGEEIPKSLRKLFRLENLIKQNEDLINSIDGMTQALEGLASIGAITFQDFSNAQDVLRQKFDQLTQAGFNQKEALAIIAPQLQLLRDIAQQYGWQLSENTRELIRQAEAQGILKSKAEEPMNMMIAALWEIVRLLGGEVPESAQKLIDALYGVKDAAEEPKKVIESWRDAIKDSIELTKQLANEMNRTGGLVGSRPPGGGGVRQGGGFQTGGILSISQPTSIIVGEAGPEKVVVIRNPREGKASAPGMNVTIHINAMGGNAKDIARAVREELERLAERGRFRVFGGAITDRR